MPIQFTYTNSYRIPGYFLFMRNKSISWRDRMWKWQILLDFRCQSVIRLLSADSVWFLSPICWQSMSVSFVSIFDSNLLALFDSTNSVYNLLPFCNQKLIAALVKIFQNFSEFLYNFIYYFFTFFIQIGTFLRKSISFLKIFHIC